MNQDAVILKSDRLEVKVLQPGQRYQGSRFDWSGIIEQVTLDGTHTFCSEERFHGKPAGCFGVGLCGILEWADTHIYDSIPALDRFPLLGVGLLRKPDTSPFMFNRPYYVEPFTRESSWGENWIRIHTLPWLCCGIAVDQVKEIYVEDRTVRIVQTLTNVGQERIEANEFNHNFLKFDDLPVCSDYRTLVPYAPNITLRRGEVTLLTNGYRPCRFDEATDSIAFRVRGCEDLGAHWMKVENEAVHASVLVEEPFPVTCMYCFTNPDTFSTETYKQISLAPGETMSYERKYTFDA